MTLSVMPQTGRRTPLARYVDLLTPRLERMAAFYARRSGVDQDDLLQEAWLGLLYAWQVLDESIGDPRQFLVKHARWRLLTHLRRTLGRRSLPIPPDLVREDAWLSSADVRLDVEYLKPLLAPMQQRILDCLFAGMTWREAGDQLGCTSANVAYHMRKIRATMA